MNDLINAIAKTADPLTLAGLLNCLQSAEENHHVTGPEVVAAERAMLKLTQVLYANVGEAEADRLIFAA